jgi:hypothetical protein
MVETNLTENDWIFFEPYLDAKEFNDGTIF